MSLELNEEIDIKSETIEEHDFVSNEIDIKSETFEEQDNAFESNVTSGNSITLSGNDTDIEIEVDPVEIGGEVETSLTKPVFGKRLACEICRKTFRKRHQLVEHLKSEHSIDNVKPFIQIVTKCFVCNKNFADQSTYKVHLLSHADLLHSLFNSDENGSCKYTCKICGCVLRRKLNHVHHIKTVHLRLQEYKCNICSTYCSKKCGLIRHFIVKHSEFEHFYCEVCRSKFNDKSRLKRHLVKKHKLDENSVASLLTAQSACKSSLFCKVCDIEFKSCNDFHQHISDVHVSLDQNICPTCHKHFTCIVTLIGHLHTHSGTKLEQDSKFESNGTSGESNTLSGIATDIKTDEVPVELVEDVATTSLMKNSVSDNSNNCKICHRNYRSQNHLQKHIRHEHNAIDYEHCIMECLVKCFVCDETFTTQYSFNVHLLSHAEYLHPLFSGERKNATTFVCKICGITLNAEVKIVQHVKSFHLGLKEYKCKVCSLYFTMGVNLIRHFILKHCEYDSVACMLCNSKKFKQKNFKTHLLMIHKLDENSVASSLTACKKVIDSNFICQVCDVELLSRNDFHQHIIDVHISLDKINCPVCQKDFTCIATLIDHLVNDCGKNQGKSIEFESNKISGDHATLSGNETDIKIDVDPVEIGGEVVTTPLLANCIAGDYFACEICSKMFNEQCSLVQHLRRNHNVGLSCIKCFVCNEIFATQERLIVHLLSHAAILSPLFRVVKNDSGTFDCKICGAKKRGPVKVIQHIKSIHLGLKEYQCKVCSSYFQRKNGLLDHFISQHSFIEPCSCKICSSKSSSKSNNKEHMKNIHKLDEMSVARSLPAVSNCNISIFCNECDVEFKNRLNFNQHISDVHEGLDKIKCPACQKNFTCIVKVIDHLHAHCGKKVFNVTGTDLLKKHNASEHTSSLTCSSCKDNFRCVQSLNIHLANEHKNTFEMSKSSNSQNSVNYEICNQDFNNPTSLKNHFNKIHKVNKKQTSLLKCKRERQKDSQREHRTAEYMKNRLGSSPVKPQLQQAIEGRKVKPDCTSKAKSGAEIWITKVKPCWVLLDRGEVTRYLARLDKREEGTVGSSPIEDLPPPLATPPVRVYPSHPCGRVRITSDHLLSAATSNVGLVCNNIRPRINVEPKQLCVVNSGYGEVSSNNCIKSANPPSQQLGNFEEMYIQSEPIFSEVSDFGDPLSN